MSPSTRKTLDLLALLGCLAGCGDGLARSLPGDTTPAPPTLGDYGQPCGSLGNSQPMLATLSAAGDAVALAVAPGHVEVRDTRDGRVGASFDAHVGRVMAMAFSPKEDLLATAGIEGAVKLWRDGMLLAETPVFNHPIASAVWDHHGRRLAVVSERGLIAVLAVEDNPLRPLWSKGGGYQGQPIFDANDGVVIAPNPNGNQVLNAVDGTLAPALTLPLSDASWTDFNYTVRAQSSDGSLIAYDGTGGGHLTIAKVTTDGTSRVVSPLWERGIPTTLGGIVFTGDSKGVVVWGSSGARTPYDLATSTEPASVYAVDNGNLVTTLAWANGSVSQIAFSVDGRFALAVDAKANGGAARLVALDSGDALTLATQDPVAASLGTSVNYTSVGVSADATMMASQVIGGAGVTAMALWNLTTLQEAGQVPWPNADLLVSRGWPNLSAKGDLLFGAEYDSMPGGSGVVRLQSLVDPSNNTSLAVASMPAAFALTADGRILAGAWEVSETATQAEWKIWLYDLVAGAYTGEFSIGYRPVDRMRFSPDGTALALVRQGSWLAEGPHPTTGMSVWRAHDGHLLWEPSGTTFPIQDVAFSPDGAWLAVAGWGGTGASDGPGVVVYDAHRGTKLETLDQTGGFRPSVRFSPDGSHVLVASLWEGIDIWRTSDWQRYNPLGGTYGNDAVFLPDNRGVLEIATGVVWCPNPNGG